MLTLGIVRTSSALPSLNRIFLAEDDSSYRLSPLDS